MSAYELIEMVYRSFKGESNVVRYLLTNRPGDEKLGRLQHIIHYDRKNEGGKRKAGRKQDRLNNRKKERKKGRKKDRQTDRQK